MVSAPPAMFYLNTQCIRYWWKSVVIRGVYNKRGSGRGRGRGHGGRGTTACAVKDVEPENLILPITDKPYSLRKRLPSMCSSTYEMRKSSHTRLACGKQMQHIELDTKGKPTKIGTQL